MSFNSARSASSAGKSKRSRNSAASNPSSISDSGGDSDRKDKRNKGTNQKTLGMAWGSNSRSSSLSSFRSSPFSDFGSYMVEKNRKLHHQFKADASSSSHGGSSTIFCGVSIFVDGFTIPSSQELRAYMLKHGGRFENYFSRHHVTHIICSNLPDSKIKNLRSFSRGLPVVKPKWIVDSVAANKLLNWSAYELNELANNQPKLSAFFTLKSCSITKDDCKDSVCQVDDVAESSLNDRIIKGAVSESEEALEDIIERGERQPDGHNSDGTLKEGFVDCYLEPLEKYGTEVTNMRMGAEVTNMRMEEQCTFRELQDCPSEPSTSASSYYLNMPDMRKLPTSAGQRQFPNSHSTLGDPNFVENYFKYSRLHFIGTWRHRYRKRYPGLSSGFKSLSSSTKASENPQRTSTIHVDMDCFFVSVVIRDLPELQDKPVAVCHSDNPKGTAEISSANYPARDYGVKAGMFVRDAKALCPHLMIFPYNFEAYEEAADQFYDILHKHCKKVQAVSCDEAFLDVEESEAEDPQLLASNIRKEIYETTRCTASAGIACNMLMARLATRTAKPNGQCYIPFERVDDYLHELPIKALPGIGPVLEDKLKQCNICTCGQLRLVPKESLQKDFGSKTGEMLWNYSRGVDNRLVATIQETKSIGAEVNWGVRFKDLKDSRQFLSNLCKEVSLRLQGCGVQGRKFTLKIKKRYKDAEEPVKYMGCGDCENLSHSVTVPAATDDVDVLFRIAMQLFAYFHIDVKEIRGVGLQVGKLESADASKQGFERNFLRSWLISTNQEKSELTHDAGDSSHTVSEEQSFDGTKVQLHAESAGGIVQTENTRAVGEASSSKYPEPPPLCHLDMEVVESLPPELLSELNQAYGGKLVKLISRCNGSNDEAVEPFSSVVGPLDKVQINDMTEQPQLQTEESAQDTALGSFDLAASDPFRKNEFMPSSLSQVDPSVFRQLPEELRDGIVQLLPPHREESTSTVDLITCSNMPQEKVVTNESIKKSNLDLLDAELWAGTPPRWVDQFKISKIMILDIVADMYLMAGSSGNLSPVLQRCISEVSGNLNVICDGSCDGVHGLSEVLKQYVKLKIEWDIEEIYLCLRLLKRLSIKSTIFLEVYDIIFPYVQASVSENYGGSLHIS